MIKRIESVSPVVVFCFDSSHSPSKIHMAEAIDIKLYFYLHVCMYTNMHGSKPEVSEILACITVDGSIPPGPLCFYIYCSQVQAISQKDPWYLEVFKHLD